MRNIEAVGLGALNMDNIYQVERILDDGEATVNRAGFFPGGSAANTIYGLARLGVSTGFIGAVGKDTDGEALLQDFQRAGVDTGQVRVKPRSRTGSVLCLSDKLGRRSLYVLPGANNLLTMSDLDLAYINQAKLLHVSSFVHRWQFQMLVKLTGRLVSSVKLSFAPGSLYAAMGLAALTPILSRTHILFANESEIRRLTGQDFESGAGTCLEKGCRIVVITSGKGLKRKGKKTAAAYVRDTEKEYFIESKKTDASLIIDTTGAGDAFAAGFLYGLLMGKGLEQCGRLGDIVARFSISKIGAREGLTTLSKLSQRFRQVYDKPL